MIGLINLTTDGAVPRHTVIASVVRNDGGGDSSEKQGKINRFLLFSRERLPCLSVHIAQSVLNKKIEKDIINEEEAKKVSHVVPVFFWCS